MSTSDINTYPQRAIQTETSTQLKYVVLETTKQSRLACLFFLLARFSNIKSAIANSPKTNKGLECCTAYTWMSCQKLAMTTHSESSVKTCNTTRLPLLPENLTIKSRNHRLG